MGLISTDYQVWLSGQDVTSRLDPLLRSIKVTRAAEQASDTCTLELSDPDGRIVLPQERATVLVKVAGAQIFSGFVSDVSYTFGKGDGRRLSVGASSVDHGTKAKEPVLRSKDDAGFADVAKEWGKKAGLEVSVSGSINSVQRSYWVMQNESFMSWGQRVAREIGASFKVLGGRAYFVGINEGLSASGKVLTQVNATYGQNLISGSISPIISRPKFKEVELSYFDVKKGERVKVKVGTGIDDIDTALRTVIGYVDEAQAKQKAGAEGKRSDREKGGGSVSILGDPSAEPEALCNISGIRPGIDGSYRIAAVTHNLSKGGGFTTELDLKQPQNGAGVDKRGSSRSLSSASASSGARGSASGAASL